MGLAIEFSKGIGDLTKKRNRKWPQRSKGWGEKKKERIIEKDAKYK